MIALALRLIGLACFIAEALNIRSPLDLTAVGLACWLGSTFA